MRAAGLLIFVGALVTGSGSAAQPRPNDVAEVVVRGVAPSNAYAQVLFEVKNKTSKLLVLCQA